MQCGCDNSGLCAVHTLLVHTLAADIFCNPAIASSFWTSSWISHILLCHSLTPLVHPASLSVKRADQLRNPWKIRTDCRRVSETQRWDLRVEIGGIQLPDGDGLDIRSDWTIWDWSVFTHSHIYSSLGRKLCVYVWANFRIRVVHCLGLTEVYVKNVSH